MRVDWCVSSWFRIKNTHSHTLPRPRVEIPHLEPGHQLRLRLYEWLPRPWADDPRLLAAINTIRLRRPPKCARREYYHML